MRPIAIYVISAIGAIVLSAGLSVGNAKAAGISPAVFPCFEAINALPTGPEVKDEIVVAEWILFKSEIDAATDAISGAFSSLKIGDDDSRTPELLFAKAETWLRRCQMEMNASKGTLDTIRSHYQSSAVHNTVDLLNKSFDDMTVAIKSILKDLEAKDHKLLLGDQPFLNRFGELSALLNSFTSSLRATTDRELATVIAAAKRLVAR